MSIITGNGTAVVDLCRAGGICVGADYAIVKGAAWKNAIVNAADRTCFHIRGKGFDVYGYFFPSIIHLNTSNGLKR